MPPHPELNATIPYMNSMNKLLDDVEKELMILIEQQEDEKRTSKINISLTPAMPEFERALGSRGCMSSCKVRNSASNADTFQIRNLLHLEKLI